MNNTPKVNKSRIVGISSEKVSPSQGIQNWFVRSFTRKQKPNAKKEAWKEFKKAPKTVAAPHRDMYRNVNLSNNPFAESNTVRNLKGVFGSTPAEQARRNIDSLAPEPFEPLFPMQTIESVRRAENDPFGSLSGFNSFSNKNTLRKRLNTIKNRRNELQRQYKRLSMNPSTNNSNIKKLEANIELLRKNAEALHNDVRRSKHPGKNIGNR